jgi:hypothetical protein
MSKARRTPVSQEPPAHTHRLGLRIVASLMIVFGLAEVVTSFTHSFIGITTLGQSAVTFTSAAIGMCYVVGGVLVLTLKRWAAVLAIVLLIADVVGRVALVVTGLYPTKSIENTFSIIAGTLLAIFFALYVGGTLRS